MDIVLKHILVPTDFSENSKVALRYACALAEKFSAALHLVHVIEDRFLFAPGAEGYPAVVTDFKEVQAEVQKQLEASVSAEWHQKLKVQTAIRRGAPFVELIRYAREVPIDLIVMGTHGRGVIAHMLLGSVAERVVRKSPCPVLTVRQPEHEFVLP